MAEESKKPTKPVVKPTPVQISEHSQKISKITRKETIINKKNIKKK